MSILIVDDSLSLRFLLATLLKKAGYKDLLQAESAPAAFKILGMENNSSASPDIDLILLDIMMPEINGIEACKRIKAVESLQDIPIIMVTGKADNENLELSFEAGAIDYVVKPFNKTELLVRMSSVLKLKQEMDRRKEVTKQLEVANRKLKLLSSMDGLTGIANRRHFDETLEKEWRRALRAESKFSLILMDVDSFKPYNDHYGHQAGDDCLKKVAQALQAEVKRPADLVARYGGEEFVVVLPETDSMHAGILAEKLREQIESLQIPHEKSQTVPVVTCSLGVATLKPTQDLQSKSLVEEADKALYLAKRGGRNRVVSEGEK